MGKYFTERERYAMELMLKEKIPVKEIAVQLNKSLKTIYNEIKRGTVELIDSELRPYKIYCADHAQEKYEYNKQFKGRSLNIGNDYDFIRYIEHKIVYEHYSPYATLALIKKEKQSFKTRICLKTLYNYIDKGVFLNITNKDLPYKKFKKKRRMRKVKVALNNLRGKSIEERPKEILERAEYGHWEMDTVVGGKGLSKNCLLVLTERKTREELIIRLNEKSQDCVVAALDQMERIYGYDYFKSCFKTITVDNGVEFLNQRDINRSCLNPDCDRTSSYFCHPYCPSERGSNENTNKLIRRFIPKGEDIVNYTDEQIKKIENWINTYPRKLFDGLSAYEMATLDRDFTLNCSNV